MRINNYIKESCVDGEGIRFVIFTQHKVVNIIAKVVIILKLGRLKAVMKFQF